MKTTRTALACSLFLVGTLLVAPYCYASFAGNVNVDLYSTFTLPPSGNVAGAPYSDLIGTLISNEVLFGTNTNWDWHPLTQGFGAEITGFIQVAQTGTYTFRLKSDDGSRFLLNSQELTVTGGQSPPGENSANISLDAGVYPFEIQFYEDGTGASGVDLYLPSGVTYTAAPVPIPSPLLLLSIGIAFAGVCRNRVKV